MFRNARAILNKSWEIDRGLGQYAERASRVLWPRRLRWLPVLVFCLFICDFTSTYILLGLSGKTDVYEGGLIAGWALSRGGFPLLFAVDMAAAAVFTLIAFTARYIYNKRGFRDYGRAAFVFFLVPYILIASVAIINNVVMLFS